MTKPLFDLILGVKTLRELGIVLYVRTKGITVNEIILPMQDMNNLSMSSRIEKAWSINHNMVYEPQSTEEATQCAIHILDAKYQKQISSQLLTPTVITSVYQTKISCWVSSQDTTTSLMVH